jgi:hypothetical protein
MKILSEVQQAVQLVVVEVRVIIAEDMSMWLLREVYRQLLQMLPADQRPRKGVHIPTTMTQFLLALLLRTRQEDQKAEVEVEVLSEE